MGEHTFWEHWKRGLLAFVVVAAVVVVALIFSNIIVGVVFLCVELFISQQQRIAIEDEYLMPSILIITFMIAPYVYSTNYEKLEKINHWSQKDDHA
jgi:hypothetical protein